MRVGYAFRDITPSPGLTLSGFAARCNRACDGVDDPIEVHALAINGNSDSTTLVIVFDLLGLGPELTTRLQTATELAVRRTLPRLRTILCCTHTHSAPATVKLLGCGVADASYWEFLEKAAVEAAQEALANLCPALASCSSVSMAGLSYNRRKVLASGRVAMTADPGEKVLKCGPTWDKALLVRFQKSGGQPLAGIIYWAAHPCMVCTLKVTADYPGEVRRSLGRRLGLPFLFLQGPCANLNLPFREMTRAEMLESAGKITERLAHAVWTPPADGWAVKHAADALPLDYARRAEAAELRAIRDGMTEIARTGQGPESTLLLLKNILNVKPDLEVDPSLLQHTAATLADWASQILESPGENRPCALALDVLRLGPLWFVFVAAELFAETGLALQNRFPDSVVVPVGYASPLLGYLPTDEALDEGGYEVDFAYRFYGHPAPFARGSEPALRGRIEEMILSMAD
ncbi:MAG TPA: hypothetical protein PLP42_03035 [Acidobacteriota bacterium]|nr:hypothetical protein [Acidobacteriota bacterium]